MQLAVVVAVAGMLPMVDGADYADVLTFMSHYEVIDDERVCRVQILSAGECVSVTAPVARHLERLPYAPHVVVVRDEVDGRELYYRQAGWYYGVGGDVICAFERLRVEDLADRGAPSPQAVSRYLAGHGWELESAVPDVKEIWRLPGPDGLRGRVMLPLATDYVDFSRRFDDTLQALAALGITVID